MTFVATVRVANSASSQAAQGEFGLSFGHRTPHSGAFGSQADTTLFVFNSTHKAIVYKNAGVTTELASAAGGVDIRH